MRAPRQIQFPKMSKMLLFVLLCPLWMAIGSATVTAGSPQVGSKFPRLALQDQFQEPWEVSPTTRVVYFAASREAGDWMTTILSDQALDYLASRNAMYMADLSGMPGFVSTMFALPSLRQQPYRVGVVLQKGVLADWPTGSGMTKFSLNNMVIESIEQLRTLDALKSSLGR